MSPFDDYLDVRNGLNETEFDLEPDSEPAVPRETRELTSRGGVMPLTLTQRVLEVNERSARAAKARYEEAERRRVQQISTEFVDTVTLICCDCPRCQAQRSWLRLQHVFRERQIREERAERMKLWKGVFWGLTLSAVMLLSIAAILKWS